MLRPDPLQELRLLALIGNLENRVAKTNERGWLGEVEGLQVSLDAARQELEQMRKLLAQPPVTSVGTPKVWRPAPAKRP